MTSKRPRLFYGWLIVFVSAVGLFLGAPLMVFSFSVFFKSLVLDFHASRAAVSFAFSLFNFVGALWLPGTGVLIDRFGAKRVILVSTLLFGLVLCSAWWVGSGLWQLYLLFAVLGIAMSLAQRLITMFAWRMTFAIFGAAVLLLPLPVIAALLQNDPRQRGLRPDGDERNQDSPLTPQDKQGLTWHEIWHSPTFWIMICIFSLAGAGVHGAILHMSAIFTDKGVTAERAAIATSLVGAGALLGRLCSGYLLDRLFAPRVAILFYGATALGMAILSAGNIGNIALASSFLVGLGMGAEVETMGYMISRYFGLRAFGTAYGHAFGSYMLAGAAGVFLMGAGYDRFHSYAVPLAGFCGAMLLTLILLTRLGPYRYGVEAETIETIKPMEVPSGA